MIAHNEVQLHLTHWGSAGPKIVLVHGSAQGSRVEGRQHFGAQRSIADQGFQLIVPDRPGHGLSPDPERPDDPVLDGALIAELLDGGAHLVGHSFGGCVALNAAALRPDVTLSLTLIEPAMQKLAMNHPAVRKFGLRMLATILFSTSPERRARRFAELVGIPASAPVGKDSAEMRRVGKAIRRLRLPSAETLKDQLGAVREHRVPLLVITGGWSSAFDAVGRRAAEIGGGTHMIVDAPHHFPHLASASFNERFVAFLRKTEVYRGSS